jgi:hypothetical protein
MNPIGLVRLVGRVRLVGEAISRVTGILPYQAYLPYLPYQT